jgi:hypothetical protein
LKSLQRFGIDRLSRSQLQQVHTYIVSLALCARGVYVLDANVACGSQFSSH